MTERRVTHDMTATQEQTTPNGQETKDGGIEALEKIMDSLQVPYSARSIEDKIAHQCHELVSLTLKRGEFDLLLAEIEDKAALIKAQTLFDVRIDGKNEAARAAQLVILLQESPEYWECLQRQRTIRAQIDVIGADIEAARLGARAVFSQSRHETAEMYRDAAQLGDNDD